MSAAVSDLDNTKIRLDKWLWAARFFKTRSLATAAVNGGKVHVNDMRVKAARAVQLGDRLSIQRGMQQFTVIVVGLSQQRGPAKEAVLLYQETADSIRQRQQQSEQRRLQQPAAPNPGRRPTRQERRRIVRLNRNEN